MAALVERLVEARDAGADWGGDASSTAHVHLLGEVDGVLDAALRHARVVHTRPVCTGYDPEKRGDFQGLTV